MPFCPRCRTEYQMGIAHCADCGARLVGALLEIVKAKPRLGPVEEVPMGRFASQLEGQMWQEALWAEGIPSALVPLGGGAYLGMGVPCELRVRADQAELARALLDEPGDQEHNR